MRSIATICLLAFSLLSFAQRPDTSGSAALFKKMMSQINAKHVKWVQSTAETVQLQKQGETEIRNHANQYGVLGNMQGADIEALAFLVLMQSAKSAQEDLKAIMAKVKAINEQKAQQRVLLSKIQQQKSMTSIQLDSFKLLQNRTLALRKGGNPDTVKLVRTSAGKTSVTRQNLDNQIDQLKNDIDSMSEMGEMESLRLQMAMDRMSKMMSTLSNLLKKISDTTSTITQNLK